MKNGCWLLIPLSLCAQNELKPGGCVNSGAVFERDVAGRTVMLKDRTGYVGSVELPPEIAIWKLQVVEGGKVSSTPVRIKFDEISANDLVCVERAKVTVVPRTELERAQRESALNWQSNSVFGSIHTIDSASRKIVVMPLAAQNPPPPTEINLPAEVLLRTYPSTAMRIGDASPVRFEDLQAGERVYIRGRRAPGAATLDATLLIKGGMRAITGALVEAGAAKVRLREYGTGHTLDISIPSTRAYRTSAELTYSSGAIRLDETALSIINVADLKAGDTVLVVGTVDYDTKSGTGLGVIAQFGYFGTSPNDGDQQITWILK
ncbi:MAG TPA: hypothetical protein VEX68_24595 [Bryobacteraceae bacterium]|nr:hypothetical protein [Bryobacteraceae bacterium]